MLKKQVRCSNCGFLAIDIKLEILELTRKSPEVMQRLQAVGMLDLQEVTQLGRRNIAKGESAGPSLLTCAKHIWFKVELENKDESDVQQFFSAERKCPYFFPHNPGYSPVEHKELQRERTQRRFLIIVSVLSAAVGAAIATLVNLV